MRLVFIIDLTIQLFRCILALERKDNIENSRKYLLEEFGHKLPEPHAKYLKDGIFELRFSGKEGKIRVLY